MGRATAIIILASATVLASAPECYAQFPSDEPRNPEVSTPAYPYRTYPTTYPVPYTYEYPGPGHQRECTSWLAAENRPSGRVIVPRMRCWWQPGRDLGP